jgi:hypothetical protein
VSALEQNASLLQLDFHDNDGIGERGFLALAESLPEIKVLQRFDLSWYTGLASTMPLLLAGLRKSTSLFRFHVADCAPLWVPPTSADTDKNDGGWMQETERLGYRNRVLPLTDATTESLSPCGICSHALTQVAKRPDVIFEVLRFIPSLVPSTDNW